jgi:hypothetical protein
VIAKIRVPEYPGAAAKCVDLHGFPRYDDCKIASQEGPFDAAGPAVRLRARCTPLLVGDAMLDVGLGVAWEGSCKTRVCRM